MRKHDARKWLHAILDLLPVVLIPVFMIYSHRHNLTTNNEIEYQYKYDSNEVNTYDDLIENNIYLFNFEQYSITDIFTMPQDSHLDIQLVEDIELYYYPSFEDSDTSYLKTISRDTILNISYNQRYGNFIYFYSTKQNYNDDLYYLQIAYDSMFLNNFNAIYIHSLNFDYNLASFTNYNVIESATLVDNQNIMSTFLDNFNLTIKTYFDFGNVFNLKDVYDWFVVNVFNGYSPAIMYSVWCIIIYEFIMDLLFLLYSLFMFFIDMCQKLMDKPLNSIK